MNSTTGHIPIIPFGPDATCTLELCPIEYSIFHYRPSLAANITFLILHFVLMLTHLGLGLRLGNWWFSGSVIAGCVSNIVGYGGRILLWQNPFSFAGFLLQIILVGSAPVYYTAAIYVTITRTVENLDESLSRIKPNLYYIIFISCDVAALVFQAVGGDVTPTSALSSLSNGANKAGVDLALTGLTFQVATLLAFVGLFADYLIRYFRTKPIASVSTKLKLFLGSLSVAILLILVRCAYRVAELSEGYRGTLFHDQGLFIGLEGVLIVLAVVALITGHPGFVFNGHRMNVKKAYSPVMDPSGTESGIELVEAK